MMSSDSSDEEDLDLIREATDNSFINDSMFKNSGDAVKHTVQENENKLPSSLRRVQDENEQFRLFNVTPQFQNYVAKALIIKLDDYLNKRLIQYPVVKKKKRRVQDCIKLLKSSKYPIDIKENERDKRFIDSVTHNHNNNYRTNQIRQWEQDLNVYELKSIAISGEDILNFKDIKYWSNRSKAQVFTYAKDEKGILHYVE